MEQGWREWQLSSGPAWSHHPSLSARGVGTWGSFPMPCEDCSGALVLSQVAMNDLSPAGPIQAVEILMESPSLAHTCRMHHAVIRRMQVWSHGAHPRVTPQTPLDSAGRFFRHRCVAAILGTARCHTGMRSGTPTEPTPSRSPPQQSSAPHRRWCWSRRHRARGPLTSACSICARSRPTMR